MDPWQLMGHALQGVRAADIGTEKREIVSELYMPVWIKTATLRKRHQTPYFQDVRGTLVGPLSRDVTELVTTSFAKTLAEDALSMAIEICGRHTNIELAMADIAEKLAEYRAQERKS